MSKFPALWQPVFRKEAFDMLEALWKSFDDSGRSRLSNTIISGPPMEYLEEFDETDRMRNRDRMIFDRIMILKHVGSIPLTDSLTAELDRIRNAYPAWELDPHERSRFVAWKEVRWGYDTQYSVDDLNSMKDSDLIDLLISVQDLRVGLLESWNEFSSANSTRAMNILDMMAQRFPNGYPDVWNYGLRGISESAHENNTQRILNLLLGIPSDLFEDSEILRSTTRVIRLYSDVVTKQENTKEYWKLFDRTLKHTINDKSNLRHSLDNDWIHRSINSSIGELFFRFFPYAVFS